MNLIYFSNLLSIWFGPESVRPILLGGTFISELTVAGAILAEFEFKTCKDWVIAISLTVGVCLGVFFTLVLYFVR